MIYNKWEFIQSKKIYVGILKVPMQFLSFYALPESRSLVCSESAQNHRSPIFQRNSKYLPICLVYFDTIIWRLNSGRRNVWSLNVGQCHILHCKLFSGCSGRNVCYAADNTQNRFRIEYVLLCVKDTELWSFCEQAASLSLKDTIQSKLQIFQDELHHISRYFQKVWGLFRRWRLAL
jgi:hypothetical protein